MGRHGLDIGREDRGVDGEEGQAEWLKTAKPAQFSKHIKLLLTKARSKQALQAAVSINQLITGGLPWLTICQSLPLKITDKRRYCL